MLYLKPALAKMERAVKFIEAWKQAKK